jgi:hypothetical protein
MTAEIVSQPGAVALSTRKDFSPRIAQCIIVAAIIAAGLGACMTAGSQVAARAATEAGSDLTRLLRAMAVIKAVVAGTATAAVVWRLASPVSAPRFAVYLAACAAMSAGPALIWSVSYVAFGALILHGGLAVVVITLWRDKVVVHRLSVLIASRRAALTRSRT